MNVTGSIDISQKINENFTLRGPQDDFAKVEGTKIVGIITSNMQKDWVVILTATLPNSTSRTPTFVKFKLNLS